MRGIRFSLQTFALLMLLVGALLLFALRMGECVPSRVPDSSELVVSDVRQDGRFVAAVHFSESTFEPVQASSAMWVLDVNAWRWKKYAVSNMQVLNAIFLRTLNKVLVLGGNGMVSILCLESQTALQIDEGKGSSWPVAVGPLGEILMFSSQDERIGVYDPETGKLRSEIRNVKAQVDQMVVSNDGKSLFVLGKCKGRESGLHVGQGGIGGTNARFLVYDLMTGECTGDYSALDCEPSRFAMASGVNNHFVYLDPHGIVHTSQTSVGSVAKTVQTEEAEWIVGSADGQVVAFGTDESFHRMDFRTGHVSRRHDGRFDGRTTLSFDGDMVASEVEKEGIRIRVYDTQTGVCLLDTPGGMPVWLRKDTLIWIGAGSLYMQKVSSVRWFAWYETWVLGLLVVILIRRPLYRLGLVLVGGGVAAKRIC